MVRAMMVSSTTHSKAAARDIRGVHFDRLCWRRKTLQHGPVDREVSIKC